MTAPRITFSQPKDGEDFEIHMNAEGRDLLVRLFLNLGEANDHFHVGDQMDLEPRKVPYRQGDKILEWGKFYFRTDEWDRTYFPHVMSEQRDL